jgi:hypothetical protein
MSAAFAMLILRSRLAVLTVLLALFSGCVSAPLPKPPPPDPADETVAALTKALKLDAAQQKRTRELLKELSDRDDVIRAGWLNGAKVKPTELVASHGQFERDFFAILTDDQKRVFSETKVRMLVRKH